MPFDPTVFGAENAATLDALYFWYTTDEGLDRPAITDFSSRESAVTLAWEACANVKRITKLINCPEKCRAEKCSCRICELGLVLFRALSVSKHGKIFLERFFVHHDGKSEAEQACALNCLLVDRILNNIRCDMSELARE